MLPDNGGLCSKRLNSLSGPVLTCPFLLTIAAILYPKFGGFPENSHVCGFDVDRRALTLYFFSYCFETETRHTITSRQRTCVSGSLHFLTRSLARYDETVRTNCSAARSRRFVVSWWILWPRQPTPLPHSPTVPLHMTSSQHECARRGRGVDRLHKHAQTETETHSPVNSNSPLQATRYIL